MKQLLLALSIGLMVFGSHATEPGSVQIPLPKYTQLIDETRDPQRPAPNGYALGEAQVQLTVSRENGRATAVVQVTLAVEIP